MLWLLNRPHSKITFFKAFSHFPCCWFCGDTGLRVDRSIISLLSCFPQMCKNPNRRSSFSRATKVDTICYFLQGQRGRRWMHAGWWQILVPDKKSNCGEINFWMVAFEVPFYIKSNPMKLGPVWKVSTTFDLFILLSVFFIWGRSAGSQEIAIFIWKKV